MNVTVLLLWGNSHQMLPWRWAQLIPFFYTFHVFSFYSGFLNCVKKNLGRGRNREDLYSSLQGCCQKKTELLGYRWRHYCWEILLHAPLHEKEPSCLQIKILLSWVGGLQFHCVTRQVLLSRVVQFNWASLGSNSFLRCSSGCWYPAACCHSCFGIPAFGCVHRVIMSFLQAVCAAAMLATMKPLEAPPQLCGNHAAL